MIAFMVLTIYRMIDVKRFQPIKYNLKRFTFITLALTVMCALSTFHDIRLEIVNIILGILFILFFELKLIKRFANIFMKKIKKNSKV